MLFDLRRSYALCSLIREGGDFIVCGNDVFGILNTETGKYPCYSSLLCLVSCVGDGCCIDEYEAGFRGWR